MAKTNLGASFVSSLEWESSHSVPLIRNCQSCRAHWLQPVAKSSSTGIHWLLNVYWCVLSAMHPTLKLWELQMNTAPLHRAESTMLTSHTVREIWGICAYLYWLWQFIPNVGYIVNMITRVTQGHGWERGDQAEKRRYFSRISTFQSLKRLMTVPQGKYLPTIILQLGCEWVGLLLANQRKECSF